MNSRRARYAAVVDKRFNKRFSASPDYVRLAGSTEQLVALRLVQGAGAAAFDVTKIF